MTEGKYTKSLAKNQVYAIVHMRDIRKIVLPGNEACNRVYMIGPVKKFGLVRLSTNFSWRKQTWKDDEFLFSFKFSRIQTLRKGFHELF